MRAAGRGLWVAVALLAAAGSAQTVTTQYTAKLTDSGSDAPLAVTADATSPSEPKVAPLHVAVPNAQTPRILNFVSPAIAIPFDSPIREIEAYWNGTPLPLIDPSGTELAEEAHSFGSMIGFFKPLFSVAGIAPGNGTLEIRGFDGSHTQLASVAIPNLSIVAPPAFTTTTALAAMPHPRVYLTAARMAAIRARNVSSDLALQRYNAALQNFKTTLAAIPDVESPQFADRVYDPESYIPLLALAYQLNHDTTAAGAAHTLAMGIVNAYATGARSFGRDTGYDIRFALRNVILAYDWMNDQFTAAERASIVKFATAWIDEYHTTPEYAESHPVENYYAGYLQAIALTVVATAGDNADDDRLLTLLHTKLLNEVPVMNDRVAGGDWSEGWNYGPYAVTEFSLVNTLMRESGEDWGVDFDWIQQLPISMTYMIAPDFSQTRSYGGYSGNYANKTSPSFLAVLSTTTSNGAFAARLYEAMNANPNNDFADVPSDTFYEMIFAAPQVVYDPPALPLSYFNSGTGRFFSRSSITDPNAYFVSTENTSYSYDHFGYANGDVRLYHGDACLVCPSAYRGPSFDGEAVTPAFSTYLVNGAEQNIILGRNNQNFLVADRGTYSVVGMRFESSWATNRYDEGIVDPAGPLDYLIREAVHLRPGTLIVRDLHRRRHTTDTLSARFHLGSPAVKVSTFYPAGVTVTNTTDVDGGGNPVGTLMQLDFAVSTAPMELVTVFSETLTGTSYANGVLTLSDGTRVTFADGDVSVTVGGKARRRATRH